MKKGVVLASGGIDSTVLMYMLKKEKALAGVFFVDYNQASSEIQLECLAYHSKYLHTMFYSYSMHLPVFMRGTGAILKGVPKKKQKKPYENLDYSRKKNKEWMRDVYDYIPARNTLFILYALGWARSLGVNTVYTGFQLDSEAWSMFHKARSYTASGMDTTPGYVDALQSFLDAGAIDGDMEVVAPFLDSQSSKEDIVVLGKQYKVNLDKTYSCEFYPECGACQGCLVRARVLTPSEKSVG